MQEKFDLADTYYHIRLIPKNCLLRDNADDNNIDVFLKGKYLNLLISDVFAMYAIKIVGINQIDYVPNRLCN